MKKEEAITELSVLHERFNNGMGWRDGKYEEALDIAIEALQQEPVKHGKWIEGELYIKCSECGYPVGHLSDNYCPNCGAKMDKEGESENK